MVERVFTDEYIEYKEGFANGLFDFLISTTSDVTIEPEFYTETWWYYGYIDAFNYYSLNHKYNGKIAFSNMLNLLDDFYIERVKEININFKENNPALLLKMNNNNRY